jgi:glycosyltransferase involved in cell wall biosynthesis
MSIPIAAQSVRRLSRAKPQRLVSVAIVTPSWPASAACNGVASYVDAIAPAMARHVRVVQLAGEVQGDCPPDVLDMGRFRRRDDILTRLAYRVGLANLARHRRLRRAARSVAVCLSGIQPDILELEERQGLAFHLARLCPCPLVVRLHGPKAVLDLAITAPATCRWTEDEKRVIAVEGRAIAAAAGVTAPSVDVLERTRAYYELPLEHAAVIPNPAPVMDGVAPWRGADSDSGHVLFVGRFDRCKGGDVLLDAFAEVARRDRAARLTFVGPDRGSTDDTGRQWTIEEYLRTRLGDAHERVEWLGQRPAAEIGQLRRRAAVTVVCSRYESFGLTAVEAMAIGCPLVATAVGGLAEIVQDGRNGLLCRREDAGDLAEKILMLLADRALAERLGQQAGVDCAERYHPEVIARQTLAYYAHVLERVKETGRRP